MRTSPAAIGVTAVLALTLGACGGDDDKTLSVSDRTKASAAALEYVDGGAVTDAERGDGDDTYAYQVEVTLPSGVEIDVELDDSLAVTNNAPTASDFADDAPATTPTDAPTAAAGGGQITGTSGSDDADHVYEVDVLQPDGQDVTVELDAEFTVTDIDR